MRRQVPDTKRLCRAHLFSANDQVLYGQQFCAKQPDSKPARKPTPRKTRTAARAQMALTKDPHEIEYPRVCAVLLYTVVWVSHYQPNLSIMHRRGYLCGPLTYDGHITTQGHSDARWLEGSGGASSCNTSRRPSCFARSRGRRPSCRKGRNELAAALDLCWLPLLGCTQQRPLVPGGFASRSGRL